MPWSNNSELVKSIPAIGKLPGAAITLFREVVNTQLAKSPDESSAIQIAWGVVKKRFKQEGDVWVARTELFSDTQYYTFSAEPSESFITRTENGVEVHNYVLSDSFPDKYGTAPSEELLSEWANWINQKKPEADIDHELFDQATKMYGGQLEKIESIMSHKKGIARAIRATTEKGRLIVSIAFDKRYAKHMDRVKGLSIEAATQRNTLTNTFTKGKLLGFTLAMHQSPANPRAVRTS